MQLAKKCTFWCRGKKKLPYDAEVEYLQSSGTQWIDTGVVPSVGCSMEIDAAFTNDPDESYLGGVHWDSNRGFAVGIVKNLYSSKFTALAGHSSVSAGSIDTQHHKFSLIINTSTSATFSVDDSSATNDSITFSASDLKIPLLARRRSSSTLDYYASAFLYACKIRVGDVIVRDLIPVRKGTVGYLYDRVTGKLFGNAGTGDFVLGPDVVPVEWLETTRGQYIDTGITCGSADTTVFEFDQSYSALQSGRFIWGSNFGANQGKDDNNYYICGLNRSDVIIQVGVVYHCKTQVAPDKAIKAYINGTLFRDNTGSSPYANPFYIFRLGGYDGEEGRPSYLRIHHLTVSINNALVRSFLPVRVGTDATSWEGAMMDVLTRRIYRNKGTGVLGYGNDVN